MILLLAEISRLAGRIFPCIHIRHFIPLAEINSKFFLLAPEKRVYISITQHNYCVMLAFLFIYLQGKALL